jgi:nucleotide-binding universal stress UspA family protein
MPEENERPLVVVGVDGSDHATAALRRALHEAARRGARVLAVSAWEPPPVTLEAYYGMPPDDAVTDARVHEQRTRAVVDAVRASEPALAAVPVEVETVAGQAGAALVERARGADLLVVGHRGRGGLASVALGSVGLSCVLHAPCPVLVVPMTSATTPEPATAGAAR